MSAAKKRTRVTAKPKAPATLPFLFELGPEELPPKSLKKLAHALLDNFETLALSENLLPPGHRNEVYFSPRRLAKHSSVICPAWTRVSSRAFRMTAG